MNMYVCSFVCIKYLHPDELKKSEIGVFVDVVELGSICFYSLPHSFLFSTPRKNNKNETKHTKIIISDWLNI